MALNCQIQPSSLSPLSKNTSFLAQLVIDSDEQTLAREFFQRLQKADEAEEEYARNLQLLAKCAFCGCSPNKIANWITAQFKYVVRPSALAEKLCKAKANSLDQ
ncbi:RNA directed DNA polymerase (reverse transcriptase) [Echinococcus multilocularis]|uniref:RNA directed DNA polymerase (Reverse transcriptase) n=1 Tax=Echinococcus multilocularis TaxID=6211 RepID=A0A0S4MRY5_ECHMU|nr:RNA directed DNA polymerase (reverse transcriptase) [Echinococcus multilocularis]